MNKNLTLSLPAWFVKAFHDYATKRGLNKSVFTMRSIGPEIVKGDLKLKQKLEFELERRNEK